MKFKKHNEQRLAQEWIDPNLAPKVKKIVTEAAEYAKNKWGWDFAITSIYRAKEEGAALHTSGIHLERRAVDVRIHDQKQEAVDGVANYINGKYAYDPKRQAMKVWLKSPTATALTRIFRFIRIQNKNKMEEN